VLTETFALLIQLPPLAFGPALPPSPFAPPRELVCALVDLGRIQEPAPLFKTYKSTVFVDFKGPFSAPEHYLVNRPVDALLFLGALVGGRATWTDDRSWFDRTVHAPGALNTTPFMTLVPPTPH
jgi:hypothetical protein